MARSDITQLYQELTSAGFHFVPKGEYHLRDVYHFVKNKYPDLCDDAYLCKDNCKGGHNTPEWQHAVRRALHYSKDHSTQVTSAERRGYWLFTGLDLSPVALDLKEPSTQKVAVHTYRVLRDTVLARKIKALHKDACQICDEVIPLPGSRTYSEAHHIRPLGQPHNGPDLAANILVVCPNHHAMCDYGSIMLDLAMLRQHPAHTVGEEFIEYHNAEIAA